MAAHTRDLSTRLLRWYDAHARPLPWRATRDPYAIWISEVMLQQTRVAAVLDHYARFLRRFPGLAALAEARERDVLALWSGLGYYRRARALHQAARVLVREHKGELPRTSELLRELPGIGRYTAAAIASIAFGERTPVVDGNVQRVLTRFDAAEGKRDIWARAAELVPPSRPGDFNQAMMELGATVCLPGEPRCPVCPLQTLCKTRGPGAASPREVRRRRQLALGVARRGKSVFLVRRAAGLSLMPGLWELPEVGRNGASPIFRLRHSITVTDFSVEVFAVPPPQDVRGRWVKLDRAYELPLTGLTRKILGRLQDI